MLRGLFDDWDNDAIWSELSQHSERKTDAGCAKNTSNQMKASVSAPDACSYVRCHSKPSGPAHVNQNYATSTGLSPGGRSSPRLPLQNSRFVPRHNVSG